MRKTSKGKIVIADSYLESILEAAEEQAATYPKSKRDEVAGKILNEFFKNLTSITGRIADDIIIEAEEDIELALIDSLKQQRAFERRLYSTHKQVFEKYHVLMEICIELTEKHRKEIYDAVGNDSLFDLLIRLHARILRNGFEIGALARTGYGTGALARWRAMHEVHVTLAFIRDYGDKAANAYYDYGAVSAYRALNDYQIHSNKLGIQPFTQDEIDSMKRDRDMVIKKYTSIINNNYGWARWLSNDKIRNFRDIETAVDFSHYRPYYRYSSLGIHSEWRSLTSGEEGTAFFSDEPVHLVGPADYGFEDALRLAMIGACSATSIILNYNHSIGSLIDMHIIKKKLEDALDEWSTVVSSRSTV